MAKIKFTAFLSDARNKVDGSVFTKGPYGPVVRRKVSPSNKRSQKQLSIRNQFLGLTSQWRNLSAAERLEWEQARHFFPRTNSFGDEVILTASALFTSLNSNLLRAGLSVITTPPTPQTFPQWHLINATVTTSGITVGFAGSPNQLPTGFAYLSRATPQISNGINNISGLLKFMAITNESTASQIISDPYHNTFGATDGLHRVGFQIQVISLVSGQLSPPQTVFYNPA